MTKLVVLSADRNAFRGSFRGSNVEAEDLFDRVFGKYSEFAKDDFEYDEGFEGSKARQANDRDEYGSLREIAVDLTFVEAARGIKKNVELIYDVRGGRKREGGGERERE